MIIIRRRNNLHVHVEGIFLASNQVVCLGYTLTNKSIHPQISKMLPILRLDCSKHRRQLRSILGFANYYKKMWYRRSHILVSLTIISPNKTKLKWTEVQQKSFKKINKMMAKKVLLHYPGFKLVFDFILTHVITTWEL